MTTLILPPRYTVDSAALWKAAIDADWEVERLQGWRVPPNLAIDDVVLYGEPLFAAIVAEQLNLAMFEPCFQWVAELPSVYRQREVEFANLAKAREQSIPRFIKPADDKCFQARVYQSGKELPGREILPDDTPVLIAEPVVWEVEYRCFVLERDVETASVYMRSGQLAQDLEGRWLATEAEVAEAIEYAQAVLNDESVALPPAVVLDVGRIAGRGWAVIEANAAWGSGIYGCDPHAVLRVVRRACVKKDKLSEQHKCWVIREA
jgi:hypothetical protein